MAVGSSSIPCCTLAYFANRLSPVADPPSHEADGGSRLRAQTSADLAGDFGEQRGFAHLTRALDYDHPGIGQRLTNKRLGVSLAHRVRHVRMQLHLLADPHT